MVNGTDNEGGELNCLEKSYELPDVGYGWNYLFDGKIRGVERMETYVNSFKVEMGMFLSKKDCDDSKWIFDLKTAQNVSNVRIYTQYLTTAGSDTGYWQDYYGDPCFTLQHNLV